MTFQVTKLGFCVVYKELERVKLNFGTGTLRNDEIHGTRAFHGVIYNSQIEFDLGSW